MSTKDLVVTCLLALQALCLYALVTVDDPTVKLVTGGINAVNTVLLWRIDPSAKLPVRPE